jgi:hypothetical protein
MPRGEIFDLSIPAAEALERIRLAADLEELRNFRFFGDFAGDKDFVAKIRGRRFRLRRRIQYQNSFLPLFYGTVHDTATGCRVVGRFRMHPFVLCFAVAWCGFFWAIAAGIVAGGGPPRVLVLPVLATLLAVFIVRCGHGWFGKGEEEDVRSLLARLFADVSFAAAPLTPG